MKRFLLLPIVFLATISYAQNYTIESTFQPLAMEEMVVAARAKAYHQQIMRQRFEEYREEAYARYNRRDYNGFLLYSYYALGTGWYDSKMYYDRGAVYEMMHEYSKAKKEYKRAMKKGYYPAKAAYEQCKVNHKAWKKTH